MKREVASNRNPPKHPIGHAGMQMDMLVECRAKPVLEGDRSKPGTGMPGDAAARRNARRHGRHKTEAANIAPAARLFYKGAITTGARHVLCPSPSSGDRTTLAR